MQLVEGGDLRVVGNNLYIKALDGLKPVDLIVRCVEALLSDPLELDPASHLGPPAFMQALRRRPNLATNAVGTAVVENCGLGPYLEGLCRELLGEDLGLRDAPRWWLGDAKACRHVFSQPMRIAIRRAQEGTGRPGRAERGIATDELSPADLTELQREIRIHGADYVAEERVSFAATPSWTEGGLRAKPFAVRLYVARVDGDYHVMPGGIALDVGPNRGVSLNSPGGFSRDVWVLSEDRLPPHASRLRAHLDMPAITRSGGGLRSRVADNLFWLGRYAERADWTMRLMRGALSRLEPDSMEAQHREAVAKALNVLLAKDSGVVSLSREDTSPKALEQLVHSLASRGRSYGLTQTLDHMHHVAILIRDRLSVELWRTLQNFQSLPVWLGQSLPPSSSELLDCLDEGVATLAAFNGMAAENMTRSYAWTFMEIGRRLERAGNLSEMLLALFETAADEASESGALLFALEVADSILTYRSRYLFAPLLPLVLDLLLVDETNPRSIGFQLESITSHLDALPKGAKAGPHLEERKIVLELCTRVQLTDVYRLADTEGNETRPALKELFHSSLQSCPSFPKRSQGATLT